MSAATMVSPREIICLEGNAGTGKTSCCRIVAGRLGGEILSEYTENLDAVHREALIQSFEQGPGGDDSRIWRIAEERRSAAFADSTSQLVHVDTSLVSVVAFECARLVFGGSGSIATLVNTYRDLLAARRVVLPGKIIHLTADESVRQARIAQRGTCHPFLARADVSQYLDEARTAFLEKYLPRTCWTSIDTTRLSLGETAECVADWSRKLQASLLADAFFGWLENLSL